MLRAGLNQSDEAALQFIYGLFSKPEIPELDKRLDVKAVLERSLASDGSVSFRSVAKECGCSEELVARVWPAIRDQYPPTPAPSDKLIIVIPQEARPRRLVESILAESGFRIDSQVAAIVDIKNGMPPIAYREKRGREVPVSLKAGIAHAGFLGNDKVIEVQDEARQNGNDPIEFDMKKRFRVNAFRMCFAVPKEQKGTPIREIADLQGKEIGTTYVSTARQFLAMRGITARVSYVSGKVEESCRDFGKDAVMDIVETGSSLRKNNLVVLGEPLYAGYTGFMTLKGAPRSTMLDQLTERLQVQEMERLVA